MASRPAFKVLFQSKENRTYNVCINNSGRLKDALFSEINFNEQIGVIGHELGHITDYTRKSNWQIISTAFKYLFIPKYKIKLEAQTDISTINQGLCWQLYDFDNFLINKSTVSERYKKHKKKFYMSAQQILEIIMKSPLYSNPSNSSIK